MMSKWEHRSVPVSITPNEEGPKQDGLPRQFWARVIKYNTEDDYGTEFRSGCFTESLQRRLPRLMYGHAGWENPAALLGRGIEYRDSHDGLDVLFEFDDFNYVPMARQIAHQMSNDPSNPTLDQFSVGFIRERDTRGANGRPAITKARLGEVSSVVEGSVPGTKLLSFRAAAPGQTFEEGTMIDANAAARILARFSLGEMDLAEALADVKALSIESEDEEEDDETTPDPEDDEEFTEEELDAFIAAADGDGDEDPEDEEPPAEDEEPEPDIVPDEESAELDSEVDALFDDLEIMSRMPVVETRSAAQAPVEVRGDKPGHKFHGNQHSGKGGGAGGMKVTKKPGGPQAHPKKAGGSYTAAQKSAGAKAVMKAKTHNHALGATDVLKAGTKSGASAVIKKHRAAAKANPSDQNARGRLAGAIAAFKAMFGSLAA